jgi:hypothetical protein
MRAVLGVAVAVLIAAACSRGPSQEAGEPDGAAEATSAPVPTGAEPMCRRVSTELDERDAAGKIDWDAIEGPDDEPTDEELESIVIEDEPYPGEVAVDGERPAFPDFPDRLDVAMLSDVDLVGAVDACYEIGALADEAEAEG